MVHRTIEVFFSQGEKERGGGWEGSNLGGSSSFIDERELAGRKVVSVSSVVGISSSHVGVLGLVRIGGIAVSQDACLVVYVPYTTCRDDVHIEKWYSASARVIVAKMISNRDGWLKSAGFIYLSNGFPLECHGLAWFDARANLRHSYA